MRLEPASISLEMTFTLKDDEGNWLHLYNHKDGKIRVRLMESGTSLRQTKYVWVANEFVKPFNRLSRKTR